MNDQAQTTPLRVINSVAPIRICDNGGWTDTWFAGHGEIFNIGVYPYVEVQIKVFPVEAREHRIILYAENYGDVYPIAPGHSEWDRHPLLEAAIEYMRVPEDLALHITVYSEVPAGCSTGTSAAITVALVGALDRLTPGTMAPHEIAYAAHDVETKMLNLQSGIQDQLCAAYGGINFIDMYQYPYATLSQIQVPNSVWWELERRLVLFFLGKAHESSAVHEQVIHKLEDSGPNNVALDSLRRTAQLSRDAIYAGDFKALGRAMIVNTEAQGDLHPALISADAQQIIDIAKQHGAVGWKVNGAGGEGGSVTLLSGPSSSEKRELIQAIETANPAFKSLPIYLSRFGVRIWE
ncbi:GHMP family kinase ATP-binding protein [Aggregatilinea lenta]|uniref:GHMP family kinase ATP-binding protein n=1 Tax=Aggregatilinea lenta TaxID=913108 RepID=UPI000E5ADD29|nr:GHMP kinase [Aggregatilinea lenta]